VFPHGISFNQKKLQSFQIGDDILITVARIDETQVRIAIDAPKDVKIMRSELLEADEQGRETTHFGH